MNREEIITFTSAKISGLTVYKRSLEYRVVARWISILQDVLRQLVNIRALIELLLSETSVNIRL